MAKRTSLPQIKVISFDGDMTLWDFEKVMRQSLAHTLHMLRERVPGPRSESLTVDRLIGIRDEVARELDGSGTKLEEIRLRAFERTAEAAGACSPGLAQDLNACYRAHRFADIELYPDVIPVFDALAPHYRLGLLSNGNGYPDLCGLPGRFSFVVFAQDVGVAKPDPGIFLTTCRRAGCEPGEMLHVGDSLHADVQGANGVGAVSVWLNRDGLRNTAGIQPDYEITTLMDLLTILRRA